MCGIVAIVSPTEPVSRIAVESATAMLAHRGPDGQCVWTSADGHVGLGHARLSVAAADGMQPIVSEDGRHRLVVNGEFYDFSAIRRRLEIAGHRFRGQTDSEIVLHLYEEMGPSCLEHLRGEFAFVLWDGAAGTVFAARDRFGIKPLFYARVGDALILASEAKALFAAGLPAAWDHEAVYQHLLGCFRSDRSLFSGVRQVPPGHYLLGTPRKHRLIRYWDVSYPRPHQPDQFREELCVAEVRDVLTEAIRLRMRAHVPVGYLLSGGLDSATVLSLAAANSDRPLAAFTIAFNGRPYDESAKARVAADYVGANLHILPVTDADLADHFARSVWHGEMIQVNAHGTARFLLSRAIHAAGYRAVMAGEGADELFAGYGFVREAVLAGSEGIGRSPRIPRLLRMLGPLDDRERQIARASPLLARFSRMIDLPDALVTRIAAAVDLLHRVLEPAFAARFAEHDPFWPSRRRLTWSRQVWGREPAKLLLYVWLRTIFVNYHMAADRLDMAHAVEVRLPYLDHKLFEHIAQIPMSLLAKDGRQKHLLREAARPFIPATIANGAKQPFYAPPSALQTGSRLHEFVQETIRSGAMASLPFFDQRAMIDLVDRSPVLEPEARTMLDPLVMVAVSLCLLHDQFRLS